MTRPIWTEEEVFLVAERGHALFLQGRYAESTIIFEGLLALDPSNVYCANALAALYIRQDQPSKAVHLLTRLLETYPNDLESRARRCEALILIGRVGEARKELSTLRRSAKSTWARLEALLESAQTKTAIG
jgi:predicted Zn-dependent protease